MTFKKNNINTIDEAKEYSNYYGGVLKPEEKSIFDSNLLKPNDTLDKALLQHTAEILDNWKQSKDKVKTEIMSLTPDRHLLFKSLLAEQRTNSVPYQLVNGLSYKPIDKVVSQFEDFFLLNLNMNLITKKKK